MGVKFAIVRFFTASSLYFLLAVATSPTVNIKNGTIQGSVLKSHINGRDIFSFQGIPYALPPTGNLRFQVRFFFFFFNNSFHVFSFFMNE